MFVNRRSALVGKPSVVASSSGSAKNARYARLLPSTRKSSDSRGGASSSWRSAPVSVFGDTHRVYTAADGSAAGWDRRQFRARDEDDIRSRVNGFRGRRLEQETPFRVDTRPSASTQLYVPAHRCIPDEGSR